MNAVELEMCLCLFEVWLNVENLDCASFCGAQNSRVQHIRHFKNTPLTGKQTDLAAAKEQLSLQEAI